MVKKRKVSEKEWEQEDKKTLSINFSNELYQLLLERTGKGNIGNYIREAVEAKLKEEETSLMKAYRSLEDTPEYKEEMLILGKKTKNISKSKKNKK